MKTIAVLITCHNRLYKTIACLQSLYKCDITDDYSIDVFLVDDGSTDGTSEAVKNEFPRVNVIQGNGNLFWNRGMHLAWETAAKAKDFYFYLWLNDDTLLFETALHLMLEYSQKMQNKKIIVGATCSEINGAPTYGGFIFPNKKLIPDNTWQDCDFFNGNIVLVPAYVYNQVGILDKKFRHYLGDIDYGMRASKLGFVHSLSPYSIGICEYHETVPFWRNTTVPIINRIKHLYNPLGNNPLECFIFERRHNGLFHAIIRFFSNHLRAIFPQLWKQEQNILND
jgi:GT2 family glycosyltransferase